MINYKLELKWLQMFFSVGELLTVTVTATPTITAIVTVTITAAPTVSAIVTVTVVVYSSVTSHHHSVLSYPLFLFILCKVLLQSCSLANTESEHNRTCSLDEFLAAYCLFILLFDV